MPSLVYRLEAQGFDTIEQKLTSVGAASDRTMSRVTQAVAQMAQAWRQTDAQAEQSAEKTAKSAETMAQAFERAAAGAEALDEVDFDGVGDKAGAAADKTAGVFEQAMAKVKAAFSSGADDSGNTWDRFTERQDKSTALTILKWAAVGAAAAYAADVAVNGFDKANARVAGIVSDIGEGADRAAKAAEDYARRSADAVTDAYDQSAAAVQRWSDQAVASYQSMSDAAAHYAREAGDAAVTKGFELAAQAARAYAGEIVELGLSFDRLRQQTGQSVDGMMAQRQAAAALGVDAGTLQAALARLGDAIDGTGEEAAHSRAMLADMGISLDGLTRTEAPEVLARIAEQMRAYGPSADRATVANRLLGEGIGSELLPALDRGGAAMRAAAGEAERYGLRLSDAQVAAYARMAARQAQAEREDKAYAERVQIIWGDLAAKFSDIGASGVGALDKLAAGWNAVLSAMAQRAQAWWDSLPEAVRSLLAPGAIAGSLDGMQVPTAFLPPIEVPGSAAAGASSTAIDYLTNGTNAATTATRVLAEEQRRMFEEAKAGIAGINAGYQEKIKLAGMDETQQRVIAAREKARAEVLALFPGLTEDQAKAIEPLIKQTEALAEREIRVGEAKKKAAAEAAAANKLNLQAADELVKAIDQQAKGINKANDTIEAQIRKLESAAAASGALTIEQKVQQEILGAQNSLVDEQGRKIRDLTEAEKARIDTALRLKEANEAQKKAVEDQIRQTGRTVDSIVDYGADRFADLFGKNRRNWRDMMDDMLRTGVSMFARLAFEAAARPIVIQMVGLFGGVFGGSGGGGVAGAAGNMASSAGSSWLSNLMPSPTNFMPQAWKDFLTPWSDKFLGGGLFGSSSSVPYMGSYSSAMLEAESLGLGLGAGQSAAYSSAYSAAMLEAESLGLGLGAGQSMGGGAALGGGAAGAEAGAFGAAGMAGPAAVAVAALIALYAAGAFTDEDTPRANAQFAIEPNRIGLGSATTLDGKDITQLLQQRDQAQTAVNSLISAYDLDLDETAMGRSFSNWGGLGGIGDQFGLAQTGDEWVRRLFSWNKNADRAAGGYSDLSQGVWQLEAGVGTRVVGSPEEGTRVVYVRESTGEEIDGAEVDAQYAAWVAEKNAAFGAPGSLFSTDNKTMQRMLDRMSMGTYKPADAKELAGALTYAGNFDDREALAQAGGAGTRQGQAIALKAEAAAAAKTVAEGFKTSLADATKYFGAGTADETRAKALAQTEMLATLGLGPEGGGKALTGRAAEIAALNARIDASSAGLKAVGFDDAQVAAKQAEARETALKPYREAMADQVELANAGGSGTRNGQAVALRLAAEQKAAGLKAGVTEMLDTAGQLYAPGSTDLGAAKAAAKNSVLSAYGIGEAGGGEALTGMAAAIAAIKAEALAAKPALEAAGLTVAEVATAMGQIEGAGIGKLAQQFQKDMDKGLKALTDPEGAARDAMNEQIDAIKASAAALGDTTSIAKAKEYTDKIRENFEASATAAAQAAALAKEETANRKYASEAGLIANTAVAQQLAAVATAQTALTTANSAMAQAQQDLSAAQAAVQQQIGAAAQAAQGWTATADRLAAARRELTMGELSPYSEEEKLRLARARVDELRAAATGTDARALSAMDALPDAVRQFLELDRLFNSGSDNATYGRDFAEMQDLLRGSETIAGRQARLQQQIADTLTAQLPGVHTNVKTIAEATAALAAAEAARNGAQTGVTTAQGAANRNLAGQFDTLAGQVKTYSEDLRRTNPNMKEDEVRNQTNIRFGGSRDAILNAISDWKILNEIGEKYWKGLTAAQAPEAEMMRARIFSMGGTPTFEHGGLFGGGWRVVGERGMELEATGPARIFSAQQTRDILAPRNTANDNRVDLAPIVSSLGGLAPAFRGAMVGTESLLSRLLDEVRRLNVQVEQQRRDLAQLGARPDMYNRKSKTS